MTSQNINIGQCAYFIRDWLYKESLNDKFIDTHKNFVLTELNNLSIVDINIRFETKNRSSFIYIMWKCPEIVAELMNTNKLNLPYNYIFNSMRKIIEKKARSEDMPECLFTFFYSIIKFIGQYTTNKEHYNISYDLITKCLGEKSLQVAPVDTLYLFNFNPHFRNTRLVNNIPKRSYVNRLQLFTDSGIKQKTDKLDLTYDNARLNYAYKNFIYHNDRLSFAYLLDTVISTITQKTKPVADLYKYFFSAVRREEYDAHYKSFLETIFAETVMPAYIFGFNKYSVLIEPNMVVLQQLNLLQKNQDNKNEIKIIMEEALKVPRESYVKYMEFLDRQTNVLLIDINDAVYIKLLMKLCKNNYLSETDYDEYIYRARSSANDIIAKYLLFHKKKLEKNLDGYPIELYSTKYFTTDVGTNCNQILTGPIFLNLPNFL